MTRRGPSNYDLIEDLTAHLALGAWLDEHVPDWTGPLRATSTDTGRVTGGDTSTPTESAALHDPNSTDVLLEQARRFRGYIDQVRRLITEHNGLHAALEPMRLEDAQRRVNERTTPSTVGWCLACDRNCDGTTNSRQLVNRLCNTCRQAELRAWQASGYDETNRQLHRDQWIKAEHERRAEQHAS